MNTSESTPKLENVIQIDAEKVQAHLSEIVRGTVEETLNSLLDAEADQLCKARRYERTAGREDSDGSSDSVVEDSIPINEIDISRRTTPDSGSAWRPLHARPGSTVIVKNNRPTDGENVRR